MNIDDVIDRDSPYCALSDTLQQAAERMCLWECDSLPVCDPRKRFVGSITPRAVCRQACMTGKPLTDMRVADIAPEHRLCGRLSDGVEAIMELMVRERVWQLPLVDDSERLAGMVKYHELLRSIAGARDILVIVPEARWLDDVVSAYRHVPTWTIVTRHRELIAPDGRSSQLSRAEARLLLALAEQPGSVLGREDLTHRVLRRSWDPTDRYVDVMVGHLRKKFGETGGEARAIRTVPNEGYVLTLKVADERPSGSGVRQLPRRGAGRSPTLDGRAAAVESG